MSETIRLTSDDAHAIAHVLGFHADEIESAAERIAADLVAEKLLDAESDVLIVLDDAYSRRVD